jgi:hypothetical protein
MRGRAYRTLGRWLRNAMLGAMVFLLLPAALSTQRTSSSRAETWAVAGADRPVPAVSTHRPAAQPQAAWITRHSAAWTLPARLPDLLVLGLTFSLIVAFNLASWRHLRRVSTPPRRPRRGGG